MYDSRGKWIKAYTIGNVFYTLAWGLYFTASRIYVKEVLGGTFTDIALLTSLEFLPALLSTFWGYLGDVLGRRKIILLGFLSVPAFMMIGFTGIPWVLILAFIASLASTIAWPSVVAAVVSDIEEVGSRKYSIYAMGGSIGWGLGSISMGFLFSMGGMKLVSIMTALFMALAFTLFYIMYPEAYGQSFKREHGISVFKNIVRNKIIIAFLLAVIISYFGLEFSYNILSIKLYNELGRNEVFYGIFFGGITAFLGALFRPVAGRIVDTLGETRSFIVTLMSYTLLLYGLALAKGWVMALLWIIPIYPLYDTAAITATSKALPPELRATAIGTYGTAVSIAGSLVVIAGPIADSLGVNKATMFSAVLQLAALVIVGLYYLRTRRLKEK
ncbi:MAG: hypothetical protein B6U75_00860 [Desulfurococcales archaeon ex4484_217_1]|nr:MAG: hypothetical protein B6U76_03810 [Desulfurococcales archaeon ex4484_217_2]OYT60777.1 MAG: hypothetical protein B6U75_00860 [Desulfurococcales archaeon ex4484_217_1]